MKDLILSDADITGEHRYSLIRQWDKSLPFVNFIGLNPSRAGATENDPTIHKCMRYAHYWGGYGGIIMTNLFAFRTPNPDEMFSQKGDIVGEKNNEFLLKAATDKNTKLSIAVWGDGGLLRIERYKEVIGLVPNLHCLKVSAAGQPRHPRFLKGDLKPIPFISSY